jgi:signal transduction histidine kinase/ActR/RegA family two-component response regulator
MSAPEKTPLPFAMNIFSAYLRTWLLVAAAIAMMLSSTVLLERNTKTLDDATLWVSHTERVRFVLAQMLQTLSDLGNGLYAYDLTHDAAQFEPALAAAAAVPGRLAELKQLTDQEPAQQPLVAQLTELTHEREAQAQAQRERALSGDISGVQRDIAGGDPKRLMDAARAVVSRMDAVESSILEAHRRETERARQIVRFLSDARTALAMLLLIAIAIVTVRHAERQRKLQDELARTLRETDQRKDVFLATLSHELRNPLAPIRTATRILESPNLTPAELEQSRTIIARQVRQMASLLDDLLDISRITRGTLALKSKPVELDGILEAAIETAQPAIRQKRHSLRIERPEQNIILEADPVRLTQVVANLLANSAKYTDPDGEITLRAACDSHGIVISVRDNGIGIPPDMLPKVFGMFEQVDSHRGQYEEGLGIGLALVKGFVELHGGRVEAHSAGLEQGSEFIVRLPASLVRPQADAAAGARAAAESRPTQHSVLVADDNRDGAEILGMLLKQSGYEVHVAHTGIEAFEMAAKHHPDAAILDIGMPGMSGYEVAERIRAAQWGLTTQLIAVTGWGQDGDKQRAEIAGFDLHLTKPIDPLELELLLSQGAREAGGGDAMGSSPAPPDRPAAARARLRDRGETPSTG